jgi:hypothetical protein
LSEGALSLSSVIAPAWGAGEGGSAGAVAAASCDRLVSLRGTTAITSPPSVTVGRGGITGVASAASKASGASAIKDSVTFFQSSPDWFWTIPQTCKLALASQASSTSR